METDTRCRECSKEFDSYESILRHVKTHGMKACDYVLKWKYDNKTPLCHCGCSQNTGWNVAKRDFTKFIHGHHATGRIKSDEEKAKIGKKNAVNMKRWMSMHPEVAKKKLKQLESGRTSDTYRKVSESIHQFWATSPEAASLRKEASDRAVKLLEQGLIGPHAPFKTEWKLNPFTGAEEFMHSSWETAFLDACVSRGHRVTKVHGITIPYTHPDGSARTYVPDFLAPDDGILYEVKGRHDEVDDAKWEAARSFCESRGWRFEVLFEEVSANL